LRNIGLVRGIFENPLPSGGRRLLLPGMFVRIRLPIGQPHSALLVIVQGLKPEDRVVVGGLQQVHSGKPIQGEPVPMPSLNGPTEEATEAAASENSGKGKEQAAEPDKQGAAKK
jgi:multidrug efflux system membrane fusion protein